MTTRFVSHLAAELPSGWLPSEALSAISADGAATLAAWCQPALGDQAEDLATRHGAELATRFAGYGELSLAPTKTAQGHRALLRHARSDAVAHVALYAVTGVWSYVTYASGPLDSNDELLRLVAALRPVGLAAAGTEPVPPRAEPVTQPVAPPTGITFTTEELVAVAEAFATPSLLGYDRRIFEQAGRDVADAMLGTARRSLRARGILTGPPEQPVLAGTYESTLGLALRHDQWIQGVAQSGTAITQVSWAVRDDAAVMLTNGPDGMLHLEPFPAADLIARINAFAGVGRVDGYEADGRAVTVTAGAVSAAVANSDEPEARAVTELVGDQPTAVRLRGLNRSGGVVHGGEQSWLIGPTGCRLIEAGATADTLTLRSADVAVLTRSFTSAPSAKEPSA